MSDAMDTLNVEEFRKFLKKGGRSPSAVDRVVNKVGDFSTCLGESGKDLDEATPDDLDALAAWIEMEPETSAKIHLWALRYYYQYSGNTVMEKQTSELRRARNQRRPFALRGFRGVNPIYIEKLEAAGISNVEQLLKAGVTPESRQSLAENTGVPPEVILEYVQLSDLARVPGLKGIRARLYYDAGVDTIEELARWEPDAFLVLLAEYVEQSGFEGIAPLPKEAQYAVEIARVLHPVVEY